MRRFATSAASWTAARTLATFAAALTLQACGGGGGGDDHPTEQSALAQQETLLTQQASRYTVGEARIYTSSGWANDIRSQLLVIDTRTKSIAYKVDIDQPNWGPPDALTNTWLTTTHDRPDADGLGGSELGVSQLLFIDGGKLMQIDLSGDSIGAPRQISALHVCGMNWSALPLDEGGKNGWIDITASESGDCSGGSPVSRRLVALAAAAGDPERDANGIQAFVTETRNAEGKVTRILTLETTVGGSRLVVRSPDLATVLQTVDVPGAPAVIGPYNVNFIGSPLAKEATTALLQIDQTLYPVSWQSGTFQVGPAVLTLHGTGYSPVTADATHTYVADGCEIHRIDSAGRARLFTTVPGDPGEILTLMASDKHLVVGQQKPWTPEGQPLPTPAHGCVSDGIQLYNVLRAVDKNSGAARVIATSTADWGLWPLGRLDEQVYIGDHHADGGTRILRYDLSTDTQTTIAQNVDLLSGGIGPRHVRLDKGGADLSRKVLMWCQFSSAAQGKCEAGDALVSHDIATGRNVIMGRMPSLAALLPDRTEDSTTSVYAYSNYETPLWVNNPGLLMMNAHFSAPGQYIDLSVPWLITPGVADSLLEIPYTLAPQ